MLCQDTNTTMSGCQSMVTVSHWFNTMQLLPSTCFLAVWEQAILISLFCFGIVKEHKAILAAWFTCQFHLPSVWAVFKSRSIKRASQRDIKGLKLLPFVLYQHLDGNQVQTPLFLGIIHIFIKKGAYKLNWKTKHRTECKLNNKRTCKPQVNSIPVGQKKKGSCKNRKEKGGARCGRGRRGEACWGSGQGHTVRPFTCPDPPPVCMPCCLQPIADIDSFCHSLFPFHTSLFFFLFAKYFWNRSFCFTLNPLNHSQAVLRFTHYIRSWRHICEV